MLPPQLQQGHRSLGFPRARALASTRLIACVPSTVTQHTRSGSSWRKIGGNKQWDSHLDSQFEVQLRQNEKRARGAQRSALRRRAEWDFLADVIGPRGSRSASHWTKDKKWRENTNDQHKKDSSGRLPDEFEPSSGEKRWHQRIKDMKNFVNEDPYRAVFGKTFDPFRSPQMWSPLMPLWMSPEQTSEKVENDSTATKRPGSKSSGKPEVFSETSSFSVRSTQKPGQTPVVEASSSSWDSASAVAKQSKYDPISNRMVPLELLHESMSKPTSMAHATVDAEDPRIRVASKLASLPPNDLDLLTAENVRAAMGKQRHSTRPNVQDRRVQSEHLERTYSSMSAAATKEVEDAHNGLPSGKRPQAATIIQPALERMNARRATSSRSINRGAASEEVSADDGYSKKPMGMQTVYVKEKREADAGLREDLEHEIQSAESQDINEPDDYPKYPKGLETSFEHEKETDFLDPKQSFEQQLKEASNAMQEAQRSLDDEYPISPIGLQTSFNQEQDAAAKDKRTSFEQQLKDASDILKNAEQALHDEFNKDPVGLQTSFAKERAAEIMARKSSLEQQLKEASAELERIQLAMDDDFPKSPIGLQTSFSKERQASVIDKKASMEEQLKQASTELEQAERALDDDYPKDPIGLQTSFAEEHHAEMHQQKPQSLEQQLKDANQIMLDTQRGLAGQYEDGFTKSPVGMETSYAQERAACTKGEKDPLEKELNPKSTSSKAYKDHYPSSPIGLQILYEHERESADQGKKISLEEELSSKRSNVANAMLKKEVDGQKLAMHAHEGRFKHLLPPSLLDTRTKSDTSSSKATVPPIILQGEGDVCVNVAKFVNNDRWYKQTNSDRQALSSMQIEFQKQGSSTGMSDVKELEAEMTTMKRNFATRLEMKSREVAGLVSRLNECQLDRDRLNNKAVTWRGEKNLQGALEQEYAARDQEMTQLKLRIKKGREAQDGLMSMSIKREKGLRQKIQQAKLASQVKPSISVEHPTPRNGTDRLKDTIDDICKQNKLYQEEAKAIPAVSPTLTPQTSTGSPTNAEKKSEVSSVKWAEPAMYKVLAYDSGNDIVTPVTTPSKFADNDIPISISSALRQLYQPARFVPHFAALQSENYHVVSATRDLLVFRKVQESAKVLEPVKAISKASSRSINPIDGTCRPIHQIPTGNFASPTGFVNYDPVLTREDLLNEQQEREAVKDHDQTSSFNPRVRRQEPVFSGSSRHHKWDRNYRKERRRAWRRRVRFALSVGATSAAMVYALGVGAELARGDKPKGTASVKREI